MSSVPTVPSVPQGLRLAGGQVLVVETHRLGREAGFGSRHVQGRLREPIRGSYRCGAQIEASETLGETLHRRDVDSFTAADDSEHFAEVEPGHVVVRRSPHRQFESEIRCGRKGLDGSWRAIASSRPVAAKMTSGSAVLRCARLPSARKFRESGPCRGKAAATTPRRSRTEPSPDLRSSQTKLASRWR